MLVFTHLFIPMNQVTLTGPLDAERLPSFIRENLWLKFLIDVPENLTAVAFFDDFQAGVNSFFQFIHV